ncbi:MAG: serine/threonine-protein kinase [Pirellulaceae bacterium]
MPPPRKPTEELSDSRPSREQFGDYELLRELGRGAMGVVYLAKQRTANRLVALKLIRTDMLGDTDSAQRAKAASRFRTEAQAAAKIQHDHIVTVYEVGEIDGQPFFSMQYVDGENLSTILRDGPIDARQAVGYLQPIALAVHTAHTSGILHRDLKPHNILIDEHGRALVADFGLAKLVEDEGGLTHDGEVMGTPQYMSPEQSLNPSGVTVSADVYSLGATLYHALTGRPPFQAVTGLETLRQVMFQEPVQPRQLSPSLDQDLETICLKCLEKEPARRYGTAADLAAELARYLAGEPIVARPIGHWERTQRWVRRNPTIASLVAATFASLLAALVVISVAYTQTVAAKRRSEAGFREARRAVNYFFTRVSEDVLLDEPGMQPLRKDLLQEALTFYQGFLLREAADPSLQDEIALTYYRIGRITEATEDAAAALQWYRRARHAQEALRNLAPDENKHLIALGDTLNALGAAHAKLDEFDEANRAFQAAIELREVASAVANDEGEARRKLANARMNLGLVQRRQGDLETATAQMLAAQSLRQELLSNTSNRSALLRDLAIGYYNLANTAIAADKLEEAERYLETNALVALRQLIESDDMVIGDRYRLAVCQRRLADLKEDVASARSLYQAAADELEMLTRANPAVAAYQQELAQILLHRADLELLAGDEIAALGFFQQGAVVLERTRKADARSAESAGELADVRITIGDLQQKTGQVDAARATLETVLSELKEVVADHPRDAALSAQLKKAEQLLQSLPGTPK